MTPADLELPVSALRWCCDADWLSFDSTDEVTPISGVVGQDDAVEALRFGLEMPGAGQNVYIRGLVGTGRMTLVRQLLEVIEPACRAAPDRCYVHNFAEPERPRLLELERGQGARLRRRLDVLVEFIEQQLGPALASETVRSKRQALEDHLQQQVRELSKPFEDELRDGGLALVPVQMGTVTQPAIVPVLDGKPVGPQELQERRNAGALTDAQIEAIERKVDTYSRHLGELNLKVHGLQGAFRDDVMALLEAHARAVLETHTAAIQWEFPQAEVARFLREVVEDLLEFRLGALQAAAQFTRLYRVNVLASDDGERAWPVVVENTPTLANLVGTIEREFIAGQALRCDHLLIQGGALLRADGGYLVLDARELLGEPGSWKTLMRTLRTGKLEIAPPEVSLFGAGLGTGPNLKPQPITLDLKVILVGDPQLHLLLDAHDGDFPNLFKVLADFESSIERDAVGARYYAGVLARIIHAEGLLPFERDAVAGLVEHGARIAGRRAELTTRFGRIADVAREAVFLARKAGLARVSAGEVRAAIGRGRRRADQPARRFRRLVADGTIRVQTEGGVTGQVNGLAVVHSGPLTYGFPTRITATIGPGNAGAVNIEREAELSGAIHTKGFYILGGLLRHLLRTGAPLAFSASVAFEQSYGGIDGDSASGAEMCCLMSALTGLPLEQGLAMTGAIDQLGHIQPVGAVAEKVEGFFHVCRDRGLNGRQGVLIPRANAGDLMLDGEVVAACGRGEFHVYAVDTIHDALALLSGASVAPRGADGHYAEGSLLHLAEQRALAYWRMAAQTDPRLESATSLVLPAGAAP